MVKRHFRKKKNYPELPPVTGLCCLQRAEVWGLLGIALHQSHGERDSWQDLPGVPLWADSSYPSKHEDRKCRGGRISPGEPRKFPCCLFQLSSCLCTGGGCPASAPHAWSQKVRGRRVSETLACAWSPDHNQKRVCLWSQPC